MSRDANGWGDEIPHDAPPDYWRDRPLRAQIISALTPSPNCIILFAVGAAALLALLYARSVWRQTVQPDTRTPEQRQADHDRYMAEKLRNERWEETRPQREAEDRRAEISREVERQLRERGAAPVQSG